MSEPIHGYANFEKYANDLSDNFSKENPNSSSYVVKKKIDALLDRIDKLKSSLLASKETSNVNSTISDIITKKDSVKLAYDSVNKEKIQMLLLLQTIKDIENQLKITQAYYKNQNKGNKPVPNQISTVSKVPTLPTVNKTTTPTTEIALTPEQWGIKFTAEKAFYMDLLPARQSTIPVQGGRDVPNAMPGLNYKLITQVGKQAIPGFSPVYQNLGIKGMQVTIVGAFTGGDGSESTRKTDTPEAKSKTPWLNSKGSPSLSDNPDRGGKLSELTAYNSYTEFVQLCQQGKHMEVEINLFQVYNQSTTTQIGQDIKLQSKNGNPKFTGIVRSLDVYHATKERTWYTLIMDVTDFGMASKKAINLNNKLQAAIEAAQAELDKAKAAEAKENAEQESSTIPNDPESTQAIINIKQRILDLKNPIQKKKQLAIYDHLLEHIKTLKNKDNYAFKKYNGGQPWGTFISNIGTYSDSSFFPISTNQLLFRLRLDCRTLLGIQGTCESELYWLLDGTEGNTKPITKFIGNGTRQLNLIILSKEKKEDPFGFGPHSEEDGSESQKNSLLSQAKNLSNAERGSLIIKAIGCVAIGALGTVASVGTAGLATPGAIATTLGACAVFTSAEAYEKYDTLNKNEAQWSNAVWGDLAMDLLLTLGTVGLVRGGGAIFSKITKQGAITKGGNLFKGKGGSTSSIFKPSTSNVAVKLKSFISTLDEKQLLALKGKTITLLDDTVVTIDNIKLTTADPDGFFIRAIDSQGQVKIVKVGEIKDIPDEFFNQPKVTTNPTNSTSATQGQAAVNTVDDAIKNSKYTNTLKTYLLSLPDSQKTQAIKSLNEVDILNPNQILEIKLKNGGVVTFDGADVTSDGIIYNRTNRVSVADIESSSLKSKITTTSQSTPPPIASLDAAITKLPSKYADNAAKAAIENLPEIQQKKIINLINDIEANGLDNIEFSIKNSKIQTKVNSIKVTANGNIEITTSNTSLPVNPSDLNYKKITFPPKSPTTVPDSQSSPTQQPSTGGGGSQGSTVPTPVGLTGRALDNYNKLLPFNEKQLAPGKEIIITVNRDIKLYKNVTLKPGTQYKINKVYLYDDNTPTYFSLKDVYNFIGPGTADDFIRLEDIVDIIVPN